MRLFELFKEKDVMAKLTLNNLSGRLAISEEIFASISKEKLFALMFFYVMPNAFLALDSPGAWSILIRFLRIFEKENFGSWIESNPLPRIDNFKVLIYKSKKEGPYIKMSLASFLKSRNEIEFGTFITHLMIYFYENTDDKFALGSFINDVLADINTLPLETRKIYNYMLPIAKRHFEKMNLGLD